MLCGILLSDFTNLPSPIAIEQSQIDPFMKKFEITAHIAEPLKDACDIFRVSEIIAHFWKSRAALQKRTFVVTRGVVEATRGTNKSF